MLTVTSLERSTTGSDPLAESRLHWSVMLAVAQWRRSAIVASAAREALRALRVSETEIALRRRASSSDPATAALLRLAVTSVIAGGALLPADVRAVERLGLAPHVAAMTASAAHALAAIAASAGGRSGPAVPIDLDIGDY